MMQVSCWQILDTDKNKNGDGKTSLQDQALNLVNRVFLLPRTIEQLLVC